MKSMLHSLALIFLIMFTTSSLHAGYQRDPWGSRTWTGPGRPPHWSPKEKTPQAKPYKHGVRGKSVAPHRKNHRSHGYISKGGYWKDKHNHWHYHKYRRSGYVYDQQPKIETIIIESEKQVPVYIRSRNIPNKLQCGGRTITRNDPKTGERVIEYVSGARDCS